MKKSFMRGFSLLLCLLLCIGMFPVAGAEEIYHEEDQVEEIEQPDYFDSEYPVESAELWDPTIEENENVPPESEDKEVSDPGAADFSADTPATVETVDSAVADEPVDVFDAAGNIDVAVDVEPSGDIDVADDADLSGDIDYAESADAAVDADSVDLIDPADSEDLTDAVDVTDAEDATDLLSETELTAADPVRVFFRLMPENAAVVVYRADENGGKYFSDAEEDGSYLLLPGVYVFDVSAEGCLPLEGEELIVYASEEPIEILLTLPVLVTEEDWLLQETEQDSPIPANAENEEIIDQSPDAETVPDQSDAAESEQETEQLEAEETLVIDEVQVHFRVTPNYANLTVYSKDETGIHEYTPEPDGSYLLAPGEYFYSLQAEGYIPVDGVELIVAASEEPVELTLEMTAFPLDESGEKGKKQEAEVEEEQLESEGLIDSASSGKSASQDAMLASDTTAPTVSSVSLSSSYIKAPGSLTVSVELNDDLSGGKFGYVEFYNKQTDSTMSAILRRNAGIFTGTITAEEYANPGKYEIALVYAVDDADNEQYYYGAGNYYTNTGWKALPTSCYSVSFTVLTAPTISAQPKSASVNNGSTVSFSVSADGGGLSYQWQVYNSATGKWVNSGISSAKTSALSFAVNTSHSGMKYRCKVSNSIGAVYSNTVTLSVKTMPKITTQPKSASLTDGYTVSFSVAASGGGLSYQWQVYDVPTSTWENSSISTAKSASLRFTVRTAHNGLKYRCRVSNSVGTVYSSTVTLTVNKAAPKITAQPASVSINDEGTVTFTVAATGGSLVYQWQVRTSSSGTWMNSKANGATTATCKPSVKYSNNGCQYRCKVSNSLGTVYSNPATLTIKKVTPTFTTQPANVSVSDEGTVKFTVAARGGSLSYQWQVRTSSSGSWVNSKASGYNTATCRPSVKFSYNGYQYRCKVSNSAGTAYSNAATLTIKKVTPIITAQPVSTSSYNGGPARFSVTARGGGLSYQWQVYNSATGKWVNSGIASAKTATLSFVANTGQDGMQYRCMVSNSVGTTYSNTATLRVFAQSYNGITASTPLTLENVLKLLDAVDPDGAYIIRNSDDQTMDWFGSSTTIGNGNEDFSTAVHEQCHGFCSTPGGFTVEWIYTGNGQHIEVRFTDVFPSSELVPTIPEALRTSRFNTYINGNPITGSIQFGAYGMLDEFAAYCWGSHNSIAMKEFQQDNGLNTDHSNQFVAYAEFRYYILHYMLYAKENHPDVYNGILNNTNFKRAFATIESLYAGFAETLKNDYFMDDWNVLMTEMKKTEYVNMAKLLKP